MYVDHERADGNPIMLVLRNGFDLRDDPGCGSRGVDTVAEAEVVTRACNVIPARH
nr:hypothetical protein [Burkholderia ambifaria]